MCANKIGAAIFATPTTKRIEGGYLRAHTSPRGAPACRSKSYSDINKSAQGRTGHFVETVELGELQAQFRRLAPDDLGFIGEPVAHLQEIDRSRQVGHVVDLHPRSGKGQIARLAFHPALGIGHGDVTAPLHPPPCNRPAVFTAAKIEQPHAQTRKNRSKLKPKSL